MEKIDSSIFKAYDIRGVYPAQIDADLVYKIAQAYVKFLTNSPDPSLKKRGGLQIAVGTDMRLSGEEFKKAAISGLVDAGVDVIDLGLISTDQMYFGVVHLKADGGIMATASHNPAEFGGLKLVREQSRPISGDSGIYQIRDLVVSGSFPPLEGEGKGGVKKVDIYGAYYQHVLKTFDVSKFKPFKIVANANFGMANPAIEKLKTLLPVKFIKVINDHLDGHFPKGPSDPLLPSNRPETIAAIKELKPDLGVTWDGDGDRCFFFDEKGEFVTPAYINALLSGYYLKKFPGAKILHDTRVIRVIDYVIEQNGGTSIMTKAGHSFIKERMIKEDAVFGDETSGHYYFKDNFYLDNGLMPFLAVLDILSSAVPPLPLGEGRGEGFMMTFFELLKPLRDKFYISEEINFEFTNPNVLEEVKAKYSDANIDNIDGYDFNYHSWRFNLRSSNTQNLLRINLEADSAELLKQKTDEVVNFINRIK